MIVNYEIGSIRYDTRPREQRNAALPVLQGVAGDSRKCQDQAQCSNRGHDTRESGRMDYAV